MKRAPLNTRRGAGRVSYLAIRTRVEEMLTAGHDLTSIYGHFAGRLPIGYKQFAKYVQRYSDNHKVRPQGWAPRAQPIAATTSWDVQAPKSALPKLPGSNTPPPKRH